jgi:O-antigen ligase
MFMAFGAYVALFLSRAFKKHSMESWVWFAAFILISINVIFQSYSRTGYILYGVLMLLFIFQTFSHWKRMFILALALIALVTAFFVSTNVHNGFVQIYTNVLQIKKNNVGTSTGIRYEYVRNSIELWKQAPIFGHGTGGYRYANIKIGGITANGGISTLENAQVSPENTYMQVLAEQGFVGMILFILLFVFLFKLALQEKNDFRRHLCIGFLVTFLLSSWSQTLFFGESPRLFFILFVVTLFGPLLIKTRSTTSDEKA